LTPSRANRRSSKGKDNEAGAFCDERHWIVNGELRQNSNTRHLVFNIWQQIAELSQAMTLEPGDLIFTGTPGGVGFGFKPPRPLVVGDTVRCEVDKIGAIENRVVAEV
jgi:2-keto-4-pentenoate hydratase/2-oxohepta-3-ene-1,7-dioic acid hydratase in catechol pathway